MLLVCLSGMATAADNKLPDLMPVVIDASQGSFEVRNIGDAEAPASRVFVICSMFHAGQQITPCAAELHLPAYIAKWNALAFDVPALKPGDKYLLQLFDSDVLPRTPNIYGMKITTDPMKRIVEADESNNYVRLDTVIRAEEPALAQYSDLLPDQILSAGKEKGLLKLQVLMAGKPVEAAVRVTQSGKRNRTVLQTKSMPGDSYEHMKQTPFAVVLAAGRYDLYVQARVSPLRVYMQTRALPVVIKTGKRLERTVTIPSGRLQILSNIAGESISGLTVEISGGASYKNKLRDFDGYTIYQKLKTPVDTDVPPGKYKIKVQNPETGQTQNFDVRIKENGEVEKSLAFEKFHAGYLKFSLLVDGKKIPAKDFYKYVALTITSISSSKQIKPGSGDRLRLPSGVYDVLIHEQAWGNADTHLTGIKISDDETTGRSITLQQPGELQLVSLWQTSKLDEAECAVIKPLVTTAVIPIYAYLYLTDTHLKKDYGDKIAKCYPDINPMVVTYTRLDKKNNSSTSPGKVYSNEYPSMKTRVAAIRLVPGRYDFKLWPLKHKELQTTLKNIKIEPDKAILKELMFKWPDQ